MAPLVSRTRQETRKAPCRWCGVTVIDAGRPGKRYRGAAVVTGMIVVLYLIYREVISLGHVCPYCTSVHVITFLLFGLLVYDATGSGIPRPGWS